jgi:competence protein ComGC
MKTSKLLRNQEGFTLVEIIAVLIIRKVLPWLRLLPS